MGPAGGRGRDARRSVVGVTDTLPPAAPAPFDAATANARAAEVWERDIIPALCDYVAIPALSASFDAEWAANGHIDAAVELIRAWCAARPVPGLTVEVHRLPGRSPLLLMEVPATDADLADDTVVPGLDDDTVVLYGHLDKQPEMVGWREGLGPWTPVIENGRLYGRGGADDGYAAFAALTAIESLHAAGGRHARLVVLIEASEESGSPDLPHYVEHLADRIGTPGLVVCLDSGCGDYERLWVTTSLRGLWHGTLTVEMLTEGVHSGDASGAVASTFRIARLLLDRIEDPADGRLLLDAVWATIPEDRRAQAAETATTLAPGLCAPFPFVPGAGPTTDDPVEQMLARTWRPTLSVTGADGLPPTQRAGNVLRPFTALQLSVRLPPTVDAATAGQALVDALVADPPYGAKVTVTRQEAASGWNAPAFAPWLWEALQVASEASFDAPARAFGEGGSIPFMGMLGARFPDAQFVVTGALGPGNNAHGPNEYLDLPTARRLTGALAVVLDAHARRPR